MRMRLVTVSLGAYVRKSLAQIEWQLESGAPDCAPYTHKIMSQLDNTNSIGSGTDRAPNSSSIASLLKNLKIKSGLMPLVHVQ